MSEAKTRKNKASVTEFLNGIDDPRKRADCRAIAKIMRRVTGKRAAMWGTSIVGFGSYRYEYASGREGDWPECGFSPRAQNISLYIMSGFSTCRTLLDKLGKHKTGKSCLYIKRLSDVDTGVLEELIRKSVAEIRKRYPGTPATV